MPTTKEPATEDTVAEEPVAEAPSQEQQQQVPQTVEEAREAFRQAKRSGAEWDEITRLGDEYHRLKRNGS